MTPARIKPSEFRLVAQCLNKMSRRLLLLSDPGFTTLHDFVCVSVCVCVCACACVCLWSYNGALATAFKV